MKKLLELLLLLPALAFGQPYYQSTGGGCTAGQACTGTVITATTRFAGAAATAAAPHDLNVGGAGRFGFYKGADYNFALGYNSSASGDSGTLAYAMSWYGTTSVNLPSTTLLGWTPTTALASALDVVLSRVAAGVLMISGDGTGTASGQTGWKVGNLSADPTYSLLTGSQAASLSRANSVLNTNGTTTSLNAPNNGSGLFFTIHDITKGRFTVAAGSGLEITAGTAADNAPRALSITQTWTNGTSSNKAILANITVGTGTGNLLELQAGGTAKFAVPHDLAPAGSGTRYICINTSGVISSSASACSGT